jgi:uncharacterized protein (TIGR03663 family)
MHTDEAVHAVKFGTLLEEGKYKYDPLEYHGPTLHYLTLVFSRLAGKTSLADLDESFLRLVPAIVGTLMILLPLLFWDGLGRRAVLFTSVLLAFSPAFVFYSGYYIHEILLVFFLGCFLGCLWRYRNKPRIGWATLAGLSAGLMFCTKETCILSFGSVFLSVLLVRVFLFRNQTGRSEKPRPIRFIHIFSSAAAFILVWMLLFSAFGTHPQGMIDSLRSYFLYPGHAASKHMHIQSWRYYLDLLTWLEFIEPISWNEDGIVGLALLGFFVAFFGKQQSASGFSLPRFLALFTLILTILYSGIPYKTPWNVLPFLYGMALLAGIAGDRFLAMASGRIEKTSVLAVLLVFGFLSPLVQSVLLKTRFTAVSSNPYVYGHTGPGIFGMVKKVEQIVASAPEGKNLYIQIIAAKDDYWPWPWYLRAFPNVGYWNQVDPKQPAAPLILAHAEMEPEITKQLYESAPPGRRDLYLPLFDVPVYLRPGVEWRGYIRKDLWDQVQDRLPADRPIQEQHQTYIQPVRETDMPESIRFSHQAMATVFEIFIQHNDPGYASRAARAAFAEADRLESLLSRYIPNSDISRIAELKKGQNIIVSPETMECLQIARRLYEQTGRAFDITVGGLVELWKQQTPSQDQIREKLRSVGMNRIELDPGNLTVTIGADGMILDLGGVGKGYAVGQMGKVLREWKIDRALIHAGSSSVLALNPPDGKAGWKVRLSSPIEPDKEIRMLEMRNRALSCSGLRRGSDMIHPATGMSIQDKSAVWVTGGDPAVCDGLSTAFMVMNLEEIEQFSRNHPEFGILVLPKCKPDQEPLEYGNW